jgi:hypothetical protein
LTTTSPSTVMTASCRRITGQVDAGQVYMFLGPPRVMQVLHFTGIIPRATLTTACHAHGPAMGSGTFNYYIFGYIRSCQYCFEFSANNTNSPSKCGTLLDISSSA